MNIFNLFKKKGNDPIKNQGENKATSFETIIANAHAEYAKTGNQAWWSVKTNDIQVFKEQVLTLTDKEKAGFIVDAVAAVNAFYKGRNSYGSNDVDYQKNNIIDAFMRQLLKTKMELQDDDVSAIANAFSNTKKFDYAQHILYWPVNLLINQIEKQVRQRGLSEELKAIVTELASKVADKDTNYYDQKEQVKVFEKIRSILFEAEGDAVKPTYFTVTDNFSRYANPQLDAISETDRSNWFRLMILAQKASGAKPSAKFLAESKTLFKEIGPDKFKKIIQDWFNFFIQYKEEEKQVSHTYQNGTVYNYTTYEEIAGSNLDMLKAFVWICSHFHDKTTLSTIGNLAERSFRKIPGKGPAAAGLGNACLYTLAKSKGLDGVAHLSRLKLRIKQSNTQSLIEKYLQEAADAQGISVHEIEDLAVDDYGLTDGKAEYLFDDYKALLSITGIGKTELQWFKPDGIEQKAIPAFIKDKYKTKLKKIKDIAKEIETTLTVQRDRLDRMLKADRTLSWMQFNELYLQHGLMGYICKNLIWNLHIADSITPAIFQEGQWVNANAEVFTNISENTSVSLWHPVTGNMEQVTTWREYLLEHKILQPMKQAFREIYLLTDAEVNTRTYSNRMAAHILKQHQFNTLAKTRGWKYSLLGAYDDGRDNEIAEISLPAYNLKAEFWINEVSADDAMNDTGIWLYVATDQLRFTNPQTGEPIELVNIPAIAFSEVMRDADLFVGVASVGNDPNWQDNGGLPAYRDYWQSYSFGDLTELAKTRKSLLERLLPRLKIAPVAHIKDKFLVVKGKLRIYKIHIGSTNILMEPNDQYLCIVPDRSMKTSSENLFLPFEGDTGLSVILSKAFLLANDEAITDPTITRQINFK